MIEIQHLSKTYDSRKVLDDICLKFPRTGLVVIYGPSGCGKTTLFNCIAGLLDFEGSLSIDGTNIEILGEKRRTILRLKNIGFIFQDFKLFNNDTVYNNVAFPLDVNNGSSLFKRKRKVKDLLSLVGISNLSKTPVKNLSGGEKQRVAIARSISNDPKIILADEPTGALDEKNGEIIMDLLRKISKKSLIIVVSHSRELTEKYADEVIEMKDGKVINHYYKQHEEKQPNLPLVINEFSNKKPGLPTGFLLKHTIGAIKERKWRTLFCNFATSLGLIGVGLAITLSSSISNNIKEAYTNMIGDSKVVVSSKDEMNKQITFEGGSYIEAIEVSKKYSEYIVDVGAIYKTDFDQHFKTSNDFFLASNGRIAYLDKFSADQINEFKWLDNVNIDVYPFFPKYLNDDEIILGLNLSQIQSICFSLQIIRTVESLSDYLLTNDIYIVFEGENYDWGYEDEQMFLLKGFTLEIDPCIYSYNHLWNEFVFENQMRFTSSTSLYRQEKLPWTLKKLFYFQLKGDVDELLSLIHHDINFEEYIFEIADRNYFPNTYDYDFDYVMADKLIFYLNPGVGINPKVSDYIIEANENITNPLFGTSGSYFIMPSALMMGFSNYLYLSFDEELLFQNVDVYSTLTYEENIAVVPPREIAIGHYSKSLQNGVNFIPIDNLNYSFDSYDNIYVSQGFLDQIGYISNPIDAHLYLAYQVKETQYGSNNFVREYSYHSVVIKGVINSPKIAIYQNSDWLLTFFQTRFGISAFNLLVSSIAFDVSDRNRVDDIVLSLKRDFPEYEICNPMLSINQSVDDVCNKLELAVSLFSVIATIVSTILLAVCNYLHILEMKQDIGLARCIGIDKIESIKFLLTHSVIMCLISFILSTFEILLISIVTSSSIATALNSSFNFTFEPFSLLAMFALAFFLSIITCIIVAIPFLKMTPLEELKH